MSFRSLIRPLGVEIIERGRPIIAADVVKEAQRRYPDEFFDETERLAFNAATREVKDVLRSLTEDDNSPQLALPGLTLPSVIAIPVEGDYVYQRTSACRWDDVLAGRTVRSDNVTAAQQKLDTYDENIEVLRPLMESSGLTVGQAIKKLAVAS